MSARLLVDLEAFARNLSVIRERVAPAAHMLVVKDDAYAHGLVPIVRRAWREGIRWFGAFDAATGASVRRALGPDARIFVWILGDADDIAVALDADLDLGIGDRDLLERVARAGRGARVHLKADTGLHRNGIRPEEWAAAMQRAAALADAGAIDVVGVWSHIAEASDADDDEARRLFVEAGERARAAGLHPALSHFAASAASFARPEFRDDLVRVGAFAYGIAPAGGPSAQDLGLEQVAALVADVAAVSGPRAHLSVGSLEGLPSSLAGVISVGTPAGPRRLIEVRADGAVVEGWEGMRSGDPVRVLGAGAPHGFTDAAERLGTIGEELVLRVSPLVERAYTESG